MRKVTILPAIGFALILVACGGGGGGGGTPPHYLLSGTVTLNGSGYEGVTVTLGGDDSMVADTDSAGAYSFSVPDGEYTLTPTLASQSFSPAALSVSISGADDSGNDFAFDTYTLSGQVTLNGSGYAGVTVDLDGDSVLSTSTDSSGAYSFGGLLNGNYTLMPSMSGQSFSPAGTAVTVSYTSVSDLDFALVAYTISGQVIHAGTGESGVTITLSGMSSGAATTDGSGNYSLTGLLNGSYTVTPVLYDQAFAPAFTSVAITSGSQGGVDFSIPQLIWFVDIDSSTGTPDGLSWGTAFMDPQNGSDMAASGDQVWVAEGTYASMDTGDRNMPVLAMKDHVEYYGGFDGTETDRTLRDREANPTILTGDIGTIDDMSDNSYHVVVGADGALLDGFTVTRGNAHISDYNHPDNKGGGMSNVGVSPTVVNCVFLENSAYQNGGGMYNQDCAPIISRSSFIGNFNIPKLGTADSGGGMSNENAAPVVRDCLFEGNSAYYGGGMNNNSSSAAVDACVFVGNSAGGSYADGGGMYNSQSTPRVTNCLFQGNLATRGGGGMMNNSSGSPTVANCTFTGNSAGDGGNAIRNWSSSNPQIANCILWDVGEEVGSDAESYPSVTYCDVKGGYTGTGNINYDPYFIDAANGNYRLNSTSLCIDAGDNASVPSSVTTDLDGRDRFVDGDGLNGSEVDMGAYEYPPVWYVDADSGAPDPGGHSWADAFTHPQDAVDAAGAGDQVWVAEGTYATLDTGDATVPVLAMKEGVEIYGGFAGTESVLSQRDLDTHATVLDGGNFVNHVVVGAGSARLDGFVVQGGSNTGDERGAGMINQGVVGLKVMNSVFSSNTAGAYGGAMFNDASTVEIGYCQFLDNSSAGGGGAVENLADCQVTIYNTVFEGNSAAGGGGVQNGDVSVGGNVCNVYNCLFVGNYASTNGGAVTYANSSGTVLNATIVENAAGSHGGANYNYAGSPVIVNSIIFSNTPEQVYDDSTGGASITYSNIEGGYTGTGNSGGDPAFVEAASGNYRIQGGSPCIDTGTNVPISGLPATLPDLDGNNRIRDGDGNGTHLIDRGAYEYQP